MATLQLLIPRFLPFSLSICPPVYMIIFPNTWITECVEVPLGPSWRMCLLSLLLSPVILSLVLFSPPWQVCPKFGVHPLYVLSTWHGYVAGSIALTLDPTLNVLSFISQAHYLDRVVKGMVFLPLFSLLSLCVCLCISIKEEMYICKCIYTP